MESQSKVDKLFVGRLKQLPVPEPVQKKWDKDIYMRLVQHVCSAVQSLPISKKREERLIEVTLCMAGKDETRLSSPWTRPQGDSVILHPLVWISCNDQPGREKISQDIQGLSYLDDFCSKFKLWHPHVSKKAPWPCAEMSDSSKDTEKPQIIRTIFEVEWDSESSTATGAPARFTVLTKQDSAVFCSTIGGTIVIDKQIYGLTSAHGLTNGYAQLSKGQNDQRGPGTDSDSLSDSGDESETSDEIKTGVGKKMPALMWQATFRAHDRHWAHLSNPKHVAYLGQGTSGSDYSLPESAPRTSDFALFVAALPRMQRNTYLDKQSLKHRHVEGHHLINDLKAGEVLIIAKNEESPLEGYLLDVRSSIIIRGTVIHTKKIQVHFAACKCCLGYHVHR